MSSLLPALNTAFKAHFGALPQHVLEENQRVLDTLEAFRQDDIPRISTLMADSHRSMKELFAITRPEIDLLVSIIDRVVGKNGGARMTGGGFGGCVVALVPEPMMDKVHAAVTNEYQSTCGLPPTFYRTHPAAGATLPR